MSNLVFPGPLLATMPNPSNQSTLSGDAAQRVAHADFLTQRHTRINQYVDQECVDLAFEMFQCATSPVADPQNLDMHGKRKLFLTGQYGLGLLHTTTYCRLGIADFASMDYNAIENDPKNLSVPDMIFTDDQNAWFDRVQEHYSDIMNRNLDEPELLPFIKGIMKNVLDHTRVIENYQVMPDPTTQLTKNAQVQDWRDLLYRHVCGIIFIPTSFLSSKFGNQSVEMFNTRVPATSFA